MDDLKKSLTEKIYSSNALHVIGLTGTEGEAALKHFCRDRSMINNIYAHDLATAEGIWQSYSRAREFFPKPEIKKGFDELMALPFYMRTGTDYLYGIEKEDIVLLPQDWDRYPENCRAIEKHKTAGGSAFLIFDLYYLFYRGSIIGITGTKGKTTGTHLCCKLLQKSGREAYISGNDRYSKQILPDILSCPRDSFLILETSNRHLKHSLFKPHIGVLTNIDSDHLDEHGNNHSEYKNTKLKIFRNDSVSILPYSIYRECSEIFRNSRIITFSEKKPDGCIREDLPVLYIEGNSIVCCHKGIAKELTDLGRINSSVYPANILIIFSIASYFGISADLVIDTLNEKLEISGRFEYIGTKSGVHFINDISATTPFALINAINAVKGGIILICGGDTKGTDCSPLAEILMKRVKKIIILHNENIGNSILYEIRNYIKDPNMISIFSDLKVALSYAYSIACRGDTVLLSPSGAYFYSNFVKYPKNSMKVLFRLLKTKPKGGTAK